jgi:hypothetical protein
MKHISTYIPITLYIHNRIRLEMPQGYDRLFYEVSVRCGDKRLIDCLPTDPTAEPPNDHINPAWRAFCEAVDVDPDRMEYPISHTLGLFCSWVTLLVSFGSVLPFHLDFSMRGH